MASGFIESSKLKGTLHREGLSVVSSPARPEIDIVIIHGLNGSPSRTFYKESTSFYWPLDIQRHVPSARLMVFGYLADIDSGSTNMLGVHQHAESLLMHLKNNRMDTERPLVFIGHSFGGLVIKQTLVLSSHNLIDSQVLNATRCIFFLGTPHRGSHALDLPLTSMAMALGKVAKRQVPAKIKEMLEPRSTEAFVANSDFLKIKGSILIVNFYEQLAHPKLSDLVVDKDSAVLDIGDAENMPIARDHTGLAKFVDQKDDAYRVLYQTLQRKVHQILSETRNKESNDMVSRMLADCVKSLGSIDSMKSMELYTDPHENTLEWLWKERNDFTRWLEDGYGFFHITGKPGSGKSVLMRDLVSKIRYEKTYPFDVVLFHFFNNRGKVGDNSVAAFMRSILKQALHQQPKLFEHMIREWRIVIDNAPCEHERAHRFGASLDEGNASGFSEWSLSMLKKAVTNVLAKGSKQFRIIIILDALDECDLDDGVSELLQFIGNISSSAKPESLLVCFSCRYMPGISLPNVYSGFKLQEKNEPDITHFINSQWKSFMPFDSTADDLSHIRKSLITRAEGIFLWARLALQRVSTLKRDGATISEMHEAINTTPNQLSGVFELMLRQVNEAYAKETKTMLGVVLAASPPLSLREFRLVMSLEGSAELASLESFNLSRSVIHDDEAMLRRLQSRCGGLLEARNTSDALHEAKSSRVVQFLHQSVKDYLCSKEGTHHSRDFDVDQLQAIGHSTLARSSASYLRMIGSKDIPLRLSNTTKLSTIVDEFPLIEYAVQAWWWHCTQAENDGKPETDLIHRVFGAHTNVFNYWKQLFNLFNPKRFLTDSYSLACLAVELNLADLVDLLYKRGEMDVDTTFEFGRSYLHQATESNSKEVVEVLLKHGASLTVLDMRGLSPFHSACRKGDVEIVQLLLDAGVDIESDYMTLSGSSNTSSLMWAARGGNTDVVRLVLENDHSAAANPGYRLAAFCTFLFGQDISGLLDHEEALHEAQIEIYDIMQLLSPGDDFTPEGINHWTLSAIWTFTGFSKDVLQNLLAEISTSDPYLLPCLLETAVLFGPLNAVRGLCDSIRDFNPDHVFVGHSSTLLHSAAQNPSPAVLSYILEEQTEIDTQDLRGFTPLHIAASFASEAHMEHLLARGADISLKSSRLLTAFHMAISNVKIRRNTRLLSRLIYSPEWINLPAYDGVRPIHIAAAAGWLPTLRWLLKNGADLEAQDEWSRTALHSAATSMAPDSTDVIDFLIERGLKTDQADAAGMTPLHHVLYTYDNLHKDEYDPDVAYANIKLFIQKGAEVNIQDSHGNTVLHLAAHLIAPGIVNLLLKAGADVNKVDHRGLKPIDLTSSEGIRDTLEAAESRLLTSTVGNLCIADNAPRDE